MTTSIDDHEFGEIKVKKILGSRFVRLKVDGRGRITITTPRFATKRSALQLLNEQREEVRKILAEIASKSPTLKHGNLIGKTHKLCLQVGDDKPKIKGTELCVSLPANLDVESPEAQKIIKQAAIKALKVQAKAYLTRRIKQLAETHGYSYSDLRFSNAGTRWGSCSSSGTISLNIWLMQLDFELIDYVLIHELCHTKQMNHSPNFWALVEQILPNYKQLRRDIKKQHPYA